MIELEVRDLCKTYKDAKKRQVKAVDHVSFTIEKGTVLGLVGESGCGKSTMANLILRLLKADSGEILFDGKDLCSLNNQELHAMRRNIQIVFQDPYSSLNPRKKIGWLLAEPLQIYEKNLTKEQREERVSQMLKNIGLDDQYADRYPNELSGGQRQRVAIGLALMLNPELLICDEPVSALDVSIQAQILNLLNDLKDKFSLTYLFISHDLQVVGYLADQIAVMYLGHLVEIAGTEEILNHALHPYTKALFAASVVGANQETELLKGDIPSPVNPLSGCPFRTRCPLVQTKCAESMPVLRDCGNGHLIACFQVTETENNIR